MKCVYPIRPLWWNTVGATFTPASTFVNDVDTMGLWHFNDPAGSKIAVDSSGNGNDLILEGQAAIIAGGASGTGNSLSVPYQNPIVGPGTPPNADQPTGWQPMSNTGGGNAAAPWGLGTTGTSRDLEMTYNAKKTFTLGQGT